MKLSIPLTKFMKRELPRLEDGAMEIAQSRILATQTREELRKMARALGVERGRDKWDTIVNLVRSGKLEVHVSLTVAP